MSLRRHQWLYDGPSRRFQAPLWPGRLPRARGPGTPARPAVSASLWRHEQRAGGVGPPILGPAKASDLELRHPAVLRIVIVIDQPVGLAIHEDRLPTRSAVATTPHQDLRRRAVHHRAAVVVDVWAGDVFCTPNHDAIGAL